MPGVGTATFTAGRKKDLKVHRVIDLLKARSDPDGDSLTEKTGAELADGQAASWLRRFVLER